jgi:hypothetical protein
MTTHESTRVIMATLLMLCELLCMIGYVLAGMAEDKGLRAAFAVMAIIFIARQIIWAFFK